MIYKINEQDRIDTFDYYVRKCRDAGTITTIPIKNKILKEASNLDVISQAPSILCQILFTDNLIEEITIHAPLFLRFTYENEIAQKCLISGIERVIILHNLTEEVVPIFNLCYKLNLIDEDVFFIWASECENEAIVDAAIPFITWLKEAEEESD